MGDLIAGVIAGKTENIRNNTNVQQVGEVIAVRDYIIEVSGLEDARYFDKILINSAAEGYVSSIGPSSVTVSLMRQSSPISVGDGAVCTGKEYYASFSTDSIGCVVDIFGNNKLQDLHFSETVDVEIETPPIPIADRTAVKRPMLTGIAGIDLLYPIGRGQRQLIIGDKKTGKTQIALDAIVNQAERNTLCIYASVGKTKKEVLDVYYELKKHDALQHTIIMAAFNDEKPPVLRSLPYVAVAVAEKYMMNGVDVLVVIDDLKRHADVIREISLMMGKVPGRDAYPPDIFYCHASLLEKGCQHKSGGSITILPIVETKSGDITDYISTNIISITDGQIVLSAKNFAKGQKPAIQYGLSVSRLGGAVQVNEIRKIGSRVRQQLLSYLETREIYELANIDEMNDEIRNKMTEGKEILDEFNQYKFELRSQEEIAMTFMKYVR